MQRQAFTILEVCLVLTVMLLIAALAVPSIDAMYADVRVTAASDQVRAAWAEAKAKAGDDGVPYRFAVMPQTGKYRVAPDAGEYWSGNGGASGGDAGEQPLEFEGELTSGVVFERDGGGDGSEGGGDWQTVATFQADGTAKEDVTITLQSRGTRPIILNLRALTGAVTAKYPDAGGGSP